jgi:hypothetical protein
VIRTGSKRIWAKGEAQAIRRPGTGDPDIVLSSISIERHQARQKKRDRYFLKSSITFEWIRANIPDAASRAVLIAQAFMDMNGSSECPLNAKLWEAVGVTDRYQRRRVLARLRGIGGDYEIVDRPGRPSLMRRVR